MKSSNSVRRKMTGMRIAQYKIKSDVSQKIFKQRKGTGY